MAFLRTVGVGDVAMDFESEFDQLHAETERVHQEHRNRERALLAETRIEEDALRDWVADQLKYIEKKRHNLFLRITSANLSSVRPSGSGTLIREPEAMTSSSPADTEHLVQNAVHAVAPHRQTDCSDLLPLPDSTQAEPNSQSSSRSRSAGSPGVLDDVCDVSELAASKPAQAGTQNTLLAPATNVVLVDSSVPLQGIDNASNQPSHVSLPEEIEIDVSHIIPVSQQRDAGTSTYMFCQPRSRRRKSGHLHLRNWQTHNRVKNVINTT